MDIVIADERGETRSALRLLLEQDRAVRVMGLAADAEALEASVADSRPDVVILDWGLAGDDVVANVKAAHPGVRVIVLSGRPETEGDARSRGADAFVCKGDPPERLIEAVHSVAVRGKD